MYFVRSLIRPLSLLSLLPFSCVQAADMPELTGVITNPFSVTRIHDRVNFMVSLNFNNGKTAQQWRSIDCKQGKAQLLYKDLLNDKGFTIARYYGNSYLRYAPAQDDQQITADDIHKVCKLPIKEARWEKLSATSEIGTTKLVDVNSIQHTGDILSVRLGYDYADIIWEPPYDAPLGLKTEHYLYNCKTHQGAVIAAMNFDSEGRVTDSLITATLMGPLMPDLSKNNSQWLDKYSLSAEIERQAQALIKPWALPRFKQIRYTEVSTLGKVEVQLDAQPNGYVRKLEDYGIWKVQRLTLANQLQLKFTMSISTGASLLNKLQTDLRFPLVTGQQYQAQWESIDSDKKITSSGLRCKVTSMGDAKSIADEFSGKYLLVECQQTDSGQVGSRVRLAWLQDLNVFVTVAMQVGDKPESLVKLENVSVIR